MTNLVANARDASHNADGRIDIVARKRVATEGSDQDTAMVEIAVSDNGCGMSTDVLQRAFEPFFSTKEAGRGYGLGLSQVRAFVERCNGSVSIASKLGHGTTVSLAFPRMDEIEASATETVTDHRSTRTAPDSIRGLAVLVVDDNDDVAASTAALLEHIGLVVRCSSSAEAGLELLARGDWKPRLVITDIVMPGASNGLALARQLRTSRPEIAVILCTGFSQSASEAAEEGFTILRKPYQPEELERQIGTAMRNLGHAATGV